MRSHLMFLLPACRGVLGDDLDRTPTDTATTDAFPAVFGLTYAAFAVSADGAAQGAEDRSPNPITVEITFADESFTSGLTSANSCTITLSLPAEIAADPAAPASAWAVYRLPETVVIDEGSCANFATPERWQREGFLSFGAVVESRSWSIGVGPLSAATAGDLAERWEDFPLIEPFLVGGRYRFSETLPDPFPDGWIDTAVGLVSEIDAAGQIVTEGGEPVLLTADEIDLGDRIRSGWYEIDGVTLLSPADLLLP